MNIAIVSTWAISKTSVGGTERFTIDLATQLQLLGNRVEVFMLSGKACTINEVKYTSLDILGDEKVANEYDLQQLANHDKGNGFYTMWAEYLDRSIDISRFDIVQLNSLLFTDSWPDKPRIFTIHTNPFEYQLDWGRDRLDYIVRKIRKGLPAGTVLTAPSEHYSKHFSQLFNHPVITIPHAVDFSRLKNTSISNTKVSNSRHARNSITILLPSRLELVQKRPQVVFRGVSLLPSELRKRIKIVAAGKDPQYLSNCERLGHIAKDGGFEAQFTKFSSMSEAYAQADIVALPSKSESFGYSALEALTLGIPTILNSIPTFIEIGSGNKNAHFFDNNSRAFSRTLKEMLENYERYATEKSWLNKYDIRSWGETYHKLAREYGQR